MLPSRLLRQALPRPSPSCGYSSGPAMEEKPVESSIRAKLLQALQPVHLEVHNESSMHGRAPGSETHFKVVIASQRFAGLPLLQRHRLVNEILQLKLAGPVHALSIQAKTPQQWEENQSMSQSPGCRGSKHDPHMATKLGTQG
ncbi:LOW QUALITY PROTEIN: bolA-like protein 1 [Pangshura tecta]